MKSKAMRFSASGVVTILAAGLWCGLSPGVASARADWPSPTTGGMEASLTADQFVYTNTVGYAVCPACTTNIPPCELPCYFQPGTNATAVFTFRVTNASAKPRTFDFGTSQQFDVELIDQNGAVVAAWSDGQAFAQIITTITFAPGETRTFDAPVLLQDRSGNPLAGTYWAYAFLTTIEPSEVAATTQIEVLLLPLTVSFPQESVY